MTETFPDLSGKRGRKAQATKPRAFSLYEKDMELIVWIADYFGCSNSEAVRMAVRGFATSIETLNVVRLGMSQVD